MPIFRLHRQKASAAANTFFSFLSKSIHAAMSAKYEEKNFSPGAITAVFSHIGRGEEIFGFSVQTQTTPSVGSVG